MLSERQTRFINEYMIDGNAAQAAIRVGYSKRSAKMQASRLMTNDVVLSVLNERRQRLAGDCEIRRRDVLAGLLEAIESAKVQGNPQAMIAGWREIAKMLGYYEPEIHKLAVSVSGRRLLTQFEAMSDEELVKVMVATSLNE